MRPRHKVVVHKPERELPIFLHLVAGTLRLAEVSTLSYVLWLANISFRGLRFADTIRTCRLTFAANGLRFIVTGSQTSVEGLPSVPMAVCHLLLHGRHTFYSTPHVVSVQIMASLWNAWGSLYELRTPRVLCGE